MLHIVPDEIYEPPFREVALNPAMVWTIVGIVAAVVAVTAVLVVVLVKRKRRKDDV